VMIPRKGAYVAGISLKDIADVFEIRAALEALAASLAAERITEEELEQMERLLVRKAELTEANDLDSIVEVDTDFHAILFKASRNEKLGQILNNLREQIQRFRAVSLAMPGRMKEALEEHRKIVEALSERNVALVASLAAEHIENAENVMLEAMRNNKTFGKDL
jgi:DNA-binding GntR family transcriptional regulator